MSKERLEEIRNRMIVEKQHFKYLNNEKGYWENVYTLLEQDMKYLFDTIIEQAERVQELKEENINLKAIKAGNEELIKMLEQQNKRYREALEESIHELFVGNYYEGDEVKELVIDILNKALEGES